MTEQNFRQNELCAKTAAGRSAKTLIVRQLQQFRIIRNFQKHLKNATVGCVKSAANARRIPAACAAYDNLRRTTHCQCGITGAGNLELRTEFCATTVANQSVATRIARDGLKDYIVRITHELQRNATSGIAETADINVTYAECSNRQRTTQIRCGFKATILRKSASSASVDYWHTRCTRR